ncbi:hypothetical protein B0I35DRAFT_361845 [Stachybotrys elegans]|uniref:Uncharacterized protein n=1 Tax=Stachybotrys elegans TaxID=80388 RepID=A0A8K0SJG0_9HYPO|nr:hypothetical protein B0I35DRAFT_361845 [Stachybotrys elegans]
MAIQRLYTILSCVFLSLHQLASSAPVSSDESQRLADPDYGPVPGQDPLFSSYKGKDPTFPGNLKGTIFPTGNGPPGTDDIVWQNLLAAEWLIFEFYQQGVEAFKPEDFIAAGFPNHTYDAICEIRNNEAGHLRLFQERISDNSLKPGACQYRFPFYDALSYLAIATVLEISSMAFLTGLVQTAELPSSHAAMLAIAETETRHETWALLDIWKTNPFAGPIDTIYPYPTQILDPIRHYVVPDSCPSENPQFPNPSQNLPGLSPAIGTKSLQPGSTITLNFTEPTNQPHFQDDQDFFATFFHGPLNISVPINTKDWPEQSIQVQIPELEPKGVFIMVITDTVGAPTIDNVIVGPSFLLLQPAELGLALIV